MSYRQLLIFTGLFIYCLLSSCRENKLDGKVQTIRCQYVTWACDCANWATLKDLHKYNGDSLAAHCIFIEEADTSLHDPIHDPKVTIEDVVEFTGQFYKDKGYPKGYQLGEIGNRADKARVFRYTKYRVIHKG